MQWEIVFPSRPAFCGLDRDRTLQRMVIGLVPERFADKPWPTLDCLHRGRVRAERLYNGLEVPGGPAIVPPIALTKLRSGWGSPKWGWTRKSTSRGFPEATAWWFSRQSRPCVNARVGVCSTVVMPFLEPCPPEADIPRKRTRDRLSDGRGLSAASSLCWQVRCWERVRVPRFFDGGKS